MEINVFSVGDHVWTIDENQACKCEILAIRINCLFGSERMSEYDSGDIQHFSDKATIGMGVKYTLVRIGGITKFTKIHEKCFKTKQELLESL